MTGTFHPIYPQSAATQATSKQAPYVFAAGAPGPSAKEAAPEAKIVARVTAKIGAAVQAAVEGAAAIKKAITAPETATVEVTATATVTATVEAPKKEEAAPAKTSNQPGWLPFLLLRGQPRFRNLEVRPSCGEPRSTVEKSPQIARVGREQNDQQTGAVSLFMETSRFGAIHSLSYHHVKRFS